MQIEETEEISSKIIRATIMVLTFIIITLAVGSQRPDVYDNSKIMPSMNFMANYFKLFIVFPISFYLLLRQVRKLKNRNIKGLVFLFQGLAIGLYGFVFIDNSHPIENNRLSEFSNYYTSNTAWTVPIIIVANIFMGLVYLVTNRKPYA